MLGILPLWLIFTEKWNKISYQHKFDWFGSEREVSCSLILPPANGGFFRLLASESEITISKHMRKGLQ